MIAEFAISYAIGRVSVLRRGVVFKQHSLTKELERRRVAAVTVERKPPFVVLLRRDSIS